MADDEAPVAREGKRIVFFQFLHAGINPGLVGMSDAVSEDALSIGTGRIDETQPGVIRRWALNRSLPGVLRRSERLTVVSAALANQIQWGRLRIPPARGCVRPFWR